MHMFRRDVHRSRTSGVLHQLRPRDFKPIIGLERGLTDPIVESTWGRRRKSCAPFRHDRRDTDQYAAESQQRLALAPKKQNCRGRDEPAFARNGKVYDYDDGVRPDSTVESLARLKPAFERPWGRVTPGNSSQITDGASWVILASEKAVKQVWAQAGRRHRGQRMGGARPGIMGLGPVLSATALLHDGSRSTRSSFGN